MKALPLVIPFFTAALGVLAGRASLAPAAAPGSRPLEGAAAVDGSSTPAASARPAVAVAPPRPATPPSPPQHDERAESGPVLVPSAPTTTRSVALRDAGVAASCEEQLDVVTANLKVLEAHRRDIEGDPLPARDDVAPRFQSAGLVSTFDDAFRATRIKGSVETVDCHEFPCIVFGRLAGDEAMVAELEDSKYFAQYDDDVGVMLTWASGDAEREGPAKAGLEREKPPEISLFAFAFYGHDDKRKHGDALDRRIRTRTAEYWNASRPDD